MGIRDLSTVSGATRDGRHEASSDYGRGEGRECEWNTVRGRVSSQCRSRNQPTWDRVMCVDIARVGLGVGITDRKVWCRPDGMRINIVGFRQFSIVS